MRAPSPAAAAAAAVAAVAVVAALAGGVLLVRGHGTATAAAAAPARPRDDSPHWRELRRVPLTTDSGWTYTTGVRTTDSSFNRSTQVGFGPRGMTIHAQRAADGAPIFSADAKGLFATAPDHFMAEADITLRGLGPGMFPAWWFRPVQGRGELDAWEYAGALLGTPRAMKSTVIVTGHPNEPYNQGSAEIPIERSKLAGGSFEGLHRWRYEKTAGEVTLSVDGNLVGRITRADLDRAVAPGSWDSMFEAGQRWYPRFTFQVGNGTETSMSGTVPSSWRSSSMTVSRLVLYRLP